MHPQALNTLQVSWPSPGLRIAITISLAGAGSFWQGRVSWLSLSCTDALAVGLPLSSHTMSQGAASVSLLIGMAVCCNDHGSVASDGSPSLAAA